MAGGPYIISRTWEEDIPYRCRQPYTSWLFTRNLFSWSPHRPLSGPTELFFRGQSTALSPFVFDNGPIWSFQITLQFAIGFLAETNSWACQGEEVLEFGGSWLGGAFMLPFSRFVGKTSIPVDNLFLKGLKPPTIVSLVSNAKDLSWTLSAEARWWPYSSLTRSQNRSCLACSGRWGAAGFCWPFVKHGRLVDINFEPPGNHIIFVSVCLLTMVDGWMYSSHCIQNIAYQLVGRWEATAGSRGLKIRERFHSAMSLGLKMSIAKMPKVTWNEKIFAKRPMVKQVARCLFAMFTFSGHWRLRRKSLAGCGPVEWTASLSIARLGNGSSLLVFSSNLLCRTIAFVGERCQVLNGKLEQDLTIQ